MPGRMEFEFMLKPKSAARRSADAPMRILILGDFSGGRNDSPLLERRIYPVDIDNFDKVLASIKPQLHLADGEVLRISDLDDFHPDALYKNLTLFQKLRDLRKRLQDSGTAAAALAELQTNRHEPAAAEPGSENGDNAAGGDENMFQRLLGRDPGEPAQPKRVPESIDRFIQNIVGPHIVSAADTQQYIDGIDSSISEQMRSILHQGDFQQLESAWLGAFWLVSNLETGEELKLYLMDIGKQALAEDLSGAGPQLNQSALFKRLVEQSAGTAGGNPWSLLIGNYFFGAVEADLNTLAAMGALASHAGGPFLAGADASLLGCRSLLDTPEPDAWQLEPDFAGQWQALRQSASAPWLGLALPRILLRLPYGAKTEPIDRFDFEEQTPAREHENYLWGNPAFACGLLIGRTFRSYGWSRGPGDDLDIDDLPSHTYQDQGESAMQACAELYLSERHADAILARGLMPVLSYRNRNQVRLANFRAIAEPAQALAGAWAV